MTEASSPLINIQQLMDRSGVRFGTSGARGLVADMTPEVCYAYTAAFLQVIAAPAGSRIALGIDLRPSSPEIARACIAAIRQAGLEADFCGVLPTPALAFHAQENGHTGDHGHRQPYPVRPQRHQVLSRHVARSPRPTKPALPAHALRCPEEVRLDPSAGGEHPGGATSYIARYLDFFPANVLAGMRLGFYEHSSVARDLLHELLQGLGAERHLPGAHRPVRADRHRSGGRGRHHAGAAGRPTHGFDAILSTDGDADRPLLGDEPATICAATWSAFCAPNTWAPMPLPRR
jgi:phosphomannomutase